MKRVLVLATAALLAACGDDDVPPEAIVCTRAVANHHGAFHRDVMVVGLPKGALTTVEYRLEPPNPDWPGLHRATCRMRAAQGVVPGSTRPQIMEIALEADEDMVDGNAAGIRDDVSLANTVPGPGNFGFDVPGYKPLWLVASVQWRCPDKVDLAKRSVRFHELEPKNNDCKVVAEQALVATLCPLSQVNAYDGSPASWSFTDRQGHVKQVANCIAPDRYQRQQLVPAR